MKNILTTCTADIDSFPLIDDMIGLFETIHFLILNIESFVINIHFNGALILNK